MSPDGRQAGPSTVVVSDVIIDCQDAARLARFWSELLGLTIRPRQGPYIPLERQFDGAFGISLHEVPEAKVGKTRIHIDVSSSDIPATKALIEALGGRRATGYEAGGFLVMQDPEGNEFCLVGFDPIEVDESGRANYLDNLDL